MSSDAIDQRRAELLRARRVLDRELHRISSVLAERERLDDHGSPRRQRKPIEHGPKGYASGCRCQTCRKGHAAQEHARRVRLTQTADATQTPAQPRRTP